MTKFAMNEYLGKYCKRQAAMNAWRMPTWIEPEDIEQDAKLAWETTNNKYNPAVEDIAHMVALFKTTLRNNITDASRIHRGDASLEALMEDGSGDLAEIAAEPAIETLIAEAPEPVKSILGLLVDPDSRIFKAPFRVYLDGTRDTPNRRLHRALAKQGIDVEPHTCLLTTVRRYLKPTRIPLFDEPSLCELVGAMVDEYMAPKDEPRPRLHYPPHLVKQAKDRVSASLKPKRSSTRVRLGPIVERVNRGSTHNHASRRVRQRASDTQSQQQVREPARTSVRPRVHGDWASCRYAGRQQRGDGR